MNHLPNYKYKYTSKMSVNNYQKSTFANERQVYNHRPPNFPNQYSYQKQVSKPNLDQSNLIKQSIESSNKLDELLNECKKIGNSAKSSSQENSKKSNSFTSINNYKLVKNLNNSTISPVINRVQKQSKYKLVNGENLKKINLNSLLNHKVVNLSKDRFKFISKNFAKIKSKNKFRINNLKKKRLVNRPLVRRSRYKIVNQIDSINRVSLNRFKLINTIRTFEPKITKIQIASNLIQRSKMTINRILKKSQSNDSSKLVNKKNLSLNNKIEKKYCLFYNRFGRCSRGENCTYIHDPKRISLCPRFLRGTCKLENCPFSHDTSPEKMPLCSFFASGCCNRENCPYQHVFYGKDAKFCVDFAKGFCPLGSKCDKIHLITCPDFDNNKKCPRGKKCPLLHKKKIRKESSQKPYEETKNKALTFVPDFSSHIAEDNIQIKDSIQKVNQTNSNNVLKLRPTFAQK